MVYLIHFEKPLAHAQHYLGYCNGEESLEQRVDRHRRGDGARLLRAVAQAGIRFQVVRTWTDGDRALERRLKGWKKSSNLCPVCRAKRRAAS